MSEYVDICHDLKVRQTPKPYIVTTRWINTLLK